MNDCGIYTDQGRMFDKRSFVLFVGKYGMLLNCPMTLSLEERIDQREGNSQPKNSVIRDLIIIIVIILLHSIIKNLAERFFQH